MGRVINPDSAGRERARLLKAIVICIRALAKQAGVTEQSRDQVAFIILALQSIAEGIDASVAAWEKRDYWVKADKFRMEWSWAAQYAERLSRAFSADDWHGIAQLLPTIAQQLGKIKVSDAHRLGEPWVGSAEAWRRSRAAER